MFGRPACGSPPDEHSPAVLHHGTVCEAQPGSWFCAPRRRGVPGRRRLIVRGAEGHRMRHGERLAEVIELTHRAGRGGSAMTAFSLRYADGNVLIGRGGDSAALYRLAMTSYPYLPSGGKWALQRRLQRLAHVITADFSLWRVNRAYPAEEYLPLPPAGLLDDRHQDPSAWRAFLEGHQARLRQLGSHIPEVYLAGALSLAGAQPTSRVSVPGSSRAWTASAAASRRRLGSGRCHRSPRVSSQNFRRGSNGYSSGRMV